MVRHLRSSIAALRAFRDRLYAFVAWVRLLAKLRPGAGLFAFPDYRSLLVLAWRYSR